MDLINRQAYGFRNFENYRIASRYYVLSQSESGFAPVVGVEPKRGVYHTANVWWALKDLNLRPTDYESAALTAELRALCHIISGFRTRAG